MHKPKREIPTYRKAKAKRVIEIRLAAIRLRDFLRALRLVFLSMTEGSPAYNLRHHILWVRGYIQYDVKRGKMVHRRGIPSANMITC